MTTSPKTSTDVKKEHSQAIGDLVTAWSTLESLIHVFLWRLSGVKFEIGACITAQIVSTNGKLDALQSLLEFRNCPSATLKEIKSICGKILEISNERNRQAHDPWMVDETALTVLRHEITAKKKLGYGWKIVDTTSLRKTTLKVTTLCQNLHTAVHKALSEISPL